MCQKFAKKSIKNGTVEFKEIDQLKYMSTRNTKKVSNNPLQHREAEEICFASYAEKLEHDWTGMNTKYSTLYVTGEFLSTDQC